MELQRFGSIDLFYADSCFSEKRRLCDNFAENTLFMVQAKLRLV